MRTQLIRIMDFDGTLIDGDSFIAFAMHCRGRIGLLRAIMKSMVPLVRWKFGIISGGEAKEALFSHLFKGMPLEEFDRLCLSFIPKLTAMERREIVDKMTGADLTIIASASIDRWIRPWAHTHGLSDDAILATGVAIDPDNRLTGKWKGRNCHGEEKLRRVKEKLATYESSHPAKMLIEVWTDSDDDLPLMQCADKAHKC